MLEQMSRQWTNETKRIYISRPWTERQEVVQLLLIAGANVLATSFNGAIPLHIAVRQGHEDAARLLIDAWSDISSVLDCRETPLHWAVFAGAKVGTAKMLLQVTTQFTSPLSNLFPILVFK